MKKYFLTNYRAKSLRKVLGLIDTIIYYPEKPNPDDRLNKNLFGLELRPEFWRDYCYFQIEKRNEFFEILHTPREKISNSNEIFLFIRAIYEKDNRIH